MGVLQALLCQVATRQSQLGAGQEGRQVWPQQTTTGALAMWEPEESASGCRPGMQAGPELRLLLGWAQCHERGLERQSGQRQAPPCRT